ncbi:hypothetical protein [Variovorax paradoxus]
MSGESKCDYCVTAHTWKGMSAGSTPD